MTSNTSNVAVSKNPLLGGEARKYKVVIFCMVVIAAFFCILVLHEVSEWYVEGLFSTRGAGAALLYISLSTVVALPLLVYYAVRFVRKIDNECGSKEQKSEKKPELVTSDIGTLEDQNAKNTSDTEICKDSVVDTVSISSNVGQVDDPVRRNVAKKRTIDECEGSSEQVSVDLDLNKVEEFGKNIGQSAI